jgi:hypothetical protein
VLSLDEALPLAGVRIGEDVLFELEDVEVLGVSGEVFLREELFEVLLAEVGQLSLHPEVLPH